MCVLLLALAEHASVMGCGLLRCRSGKSVLCLPASVPPKVQVRSWPGHPPSEVTHGQA